MRKTVFLVVLLSLGSVGCISTSEYKAFVEASRAYYSDVSPRNRAQVASDKNLSDQSKKNRLTEDDNYGSAIAAAESRLGIAAQNTAGN